MPNEIRVRQNFVGGLIDDNPLTAGSSTVTSGAFGAVPVIGNTQHYPIIIDPDGVFGDPEIVWIITHTLSSTTVNVLRGQENTLARQHPRDTPWVHGPTARDLDDLVPRVRAYTTANSAINFFPTDTYVAIPLGAEAYDSHAFHDNVTNPTRFTIPTGLDGTYWLQAQIEYQYTSASGRRNAGIRKNGTQYLVTSQWNAYTGVGSTFASCQVIEPLVGGDYIELMGYTEPAGGYGGAIPQATWMIATRIGA
jgi:hypothetical protein